MERLLALIGDISAKANSASIPTHRHAIH